MEVCESCLQRFTPEQIEDITKKLIERNDKFFCIHKYGDHLIYLEKKNII